MIRLGYVLQNKSDVEKVIISFIKQSEVQFDLNVMNLIRDHDTKFINQTIEIFSNENGIAQNFSAVPTPEKNGVTEI